MVGGPKALSLAASNRPDPLGELPIRSSLPKQRPNRYETDLITPGLLFYSLARKAPEINTCISAMKTLLGALYMKILNVEVRHSHTISIIRILYFMSSSQGDYFNSTLSRSALST